MQSIACHIFNISSPWAKAMICCLGFSAIALAAPSSKKDALLHVPSPDWRDQVIYFVLTDRFADGDPSNNSQGASEFQQGNDQAYQGGDLKGLTQRLDYIRGLGATSVWITPPALNRWLDPRTKTAGYHGYWASDFSTIDPHLGSLVDLQNLSRQLHQRGMYLIQDIVVNHTADYFRYEGGWNKKNPMEFFLRDGGPSQTPFNFNDATNPIHRRKAIYHWTPDVSDYRNARQREQFQMSGLDDLNTSNPVVRQALRKSYGDWIKKAGVDAFRVDTAFYVSPSFFDDFLNSQNVAALGINRVASKTGRHNFLVFGEGFAIDKPYRNEGHTSIAQYMPALPSMLNFPLYGSLLDVFARGAPTAVLGRRIQTMVQRHSAIHIMPSFIDNHDVDRFLASADEQSLNLALLSLFTLPGIPTIYYGTEQGFVEPRAAMFAQGAGSKGKDHFNPTHQIYKTIAQLAQLRKDHRVLSRGVPKIISANQTQAGLLVYEMAYPNNDQRLIIALNSANYDSMVSGLSLRLAPNERLEPLLTLNQATRATFEINATDSLSFKLAAKQAIVWKVARNKKEAPSNQVSVAASSRHPELFKPRLAENGQIELTGRSAPNSSLRIVFNGNWENSTKITSDVTGQFKLLATIPAIVLPNETKQSKQQVAVVTDTQIKGFTELSSSKAQTFVDSSQWVEQLNYFDPSGDDDGPGKGSKTRYDYPTDDSWGKNRQMDLQQIRILTKGGAARIEINTNQISQTWNPANQFDHVAFTIFIQLPIPIKHSQTSEAISSSSLPSAQESTVSTTVMPLQNSHLPEGMHWHRRLRLHGWSNNLTNASGASSSHEGSPMLPAAQLTVNPKKSQLVIELPAAALGYLDNLTGAKFYISTWDYDGGFRVLRQQAGAYWMGLKQKDTAPFNAKRDSTLSDSSTDQSTLNLPLIMDDTPILEIKGLR